MHDELTITEARRQLTSLSERLNQERSTLAVTRRGEPVLAILPWALYESLIETLEVMADEEMMAALRQSVREIAAGETVAWEDVKAELEL